MNKELYDSLPEELQTTYNRYCLPDDLSGLTINSVILSDENKKKVDDFLVETKFKAKFIQYGLKPVNRMINYGASGTGKTFLTKCLAAHFNYELLAIDIANALSTGNAATALEDIFDLGNHIGHAIIFLDECDAIARDRSDKSVPEDPNVRRANNALFQLLDRMNPECIFISATNLYTELDPAFVRRFNVKLKFEIPPLDDLEETIRKFMLPAFSLEKDLQQDIKDIILYHAKEYTALSYYEIQTWVERAEKTAIINDSEVIKESDIYSYFMDSLRVRVGTDEKTGKLYLYKNG
jgi:AAA+ superfamily predicted ATPase